MEGGREKPYPGGNEPLYFPAAELGNLASRSGSEPHRERPLLYCAAVPIKL